MKLISVTFSVDAPWKRFERFRDGILDWPDAAPVFLRDGEEMPP
jgi:hypothetical protein